MRAASGFGKMESVISITVMKKKEEGKDEEKKEFYFY